MSLFFSSVVFLFGLIVGSFLNCIIYRLETGKSFLRGRSFCPHCKHKLGLLDLFPVFSFIALGGQCRWCKKRISFQYPLVELATGLAFFLIFIFALQPQILYFLITPFLIVIFVYDLKHYLIPDKIIYPGIVIALAFTIFNLSSALNYLLAGLGAAVFFFSVVLLSRGKWMGVGDIKLALLMGLILGFPSILVALFLAFFTGAIIGIGLIACRRKSLKSEVPFGPFLVGGTFLAMFFGEAIIDWYFNLLF